MNLNKIFTVSLLILTIFAVVTHQVSRKNIHRHDFFLLYMGAKYIKEFWLYEYV